MTELEQATKALHDAAVEYNDALEAYILGWTRREGTRLIVYRKKSAQLEVTQRQLEESAKKYAKQVREVREGRESLADGERRLRDAEFIESSKNHPLSPESQAFLAACTPWPTEI